MQPKDIMTYCLGKPHVREDRPFGDIPICYKLNGKIFAQLYPLEHDYKITLKCTREAGEFYRTAYPGQVVRGYHCPPVQQPYWNTIHLADFPEEELCNMVDQAYETVLRRFPKNVQKQLEQTYYHMSSNGPHYVFFASNKTPVFTGVTLHSMYFSPRYLNSEQETIDTLARDHHIFLHLDPQTVFDFYTVPHVEVFASDGEGGYLVSQGNGFSFDSEDPIYYISKEKRCYLVAKSGTNLLGKKTLWKHSLIPADKTIEIFATQEDAEKKYDIHDFKYNDKQGDLL